MPVGPLEEGWHQVRRYRVPGLFMVLAPVSVIASLVLFEDVLVAFAAYHVGMCLVVPLLYEKLGHKDTWPEIAHEFGLVNLDDRRAWGEGLLVGGLMGLGMIVPFVALGRGLISPDEVRSAMGAWGITTQDTGLLFAYMLVFNSGAEELFWRGYIHERLAGWSNRSAALVLASMAFASYHWFTVWALTGQALLATVAVVGVFIGGLIWAYLRERHGTVLPALLGHLGATAGYMTVYAGFLA